MPLTLPRVQRCIFGQLKQTPLPSTKLSQTDPKPSRMIYVLTQLLRAIGPCVISSYAGCRGIKWAQTNQSRHYHLVLAAAFFHENCFGNAYPFTLADVKCFTANVSPLTLSKALAFQSRVEKSSCDSRNKRKAILANWNCSATRKNAQKHLCFVLVNVVCKSAMYFQSVCPIPVVSSKKFI